mmetsp:Transcript_23431/g.62937  ORF Transcript_23431/g.62937 Transcript_23431/m.62937 type:complete len:1015 (+) Transcript_23431:163-3207(+)
MVEVNTSRGVSHEQLMKQCGYGYDVVIVVPTPEPNKLQKGEVVKVMLEEHQMDVIRASMGISETGGAAEDRTSRHDSVGSTGANSGVGLSISSQPNSFHSSGAGGRGNSLEKDRSAASSAGGLGNGMPVDDLSAMSPFSSSRRNGGKPSISPKRDVRIVATHDDDTYAVVVLEDRHGNAAQAADNKKGKRKNQQPSHDGMFSGILGYGTAETIVIKGEQILPSKTERYVFNVLRKINKTGLKTLCFRSAEKDNIMIKVHAPLEVLKRFADQFDFVMKLDSIEARRRLENGSDKYHIAGVSLPDDRKKCEFSPYQHIYGRYDDTEELQDLYYRVPGERHPFNARTRMQLIIGIIEAREFVGGAEIKLSSDIHRKKIVACYPLHELHHVERLALGMFNKVQFPWVYTGILTACGFDCGSHDYDLDSGQIDEKVRGSHASGVTESSPQSEVSSTGHTPDYSANPDHPYRQGASARGKKGSHSAEVARRSARRRFIGAPVEKHFPLLDSIYRYFGAKIAIYFAFLLHTCAYTLFPGLLGIPVFVNSVWEGTAQPASSAFYALFVLFAAYYMVGSWPASQAQLALTFGMIGCEASETDRPEFHGDKAKSLVDGKLQIYFSPERRGWRKNVNRAVIFTFVLLVMTAISAIFWLRFIMETSSNVWENEWGSYIGSAANAVQIQIMNFLYGKLATRLTENENYRTKTEHEDSLISKLFMFQFVNSFASFYYMAFVQEWIGGGCDGYDDDVPMDDEVKKQRAMSEACMSSLMINLVIIFGQRLVVGQLTEVWMPYYLYKRSQRALEAHSGDRDLAPSINGDRHGSGGSSNMDPALGFAPPRKDRLQTVTLSENGDGVGRPASLQTPLMHEAETNGSSFCSNSTTDTALVYAEESAGKNISEAEQQMLRNDYEGTIDDYAELAIQFGYVTLFVVSFPLAPLLAYVSLMLELRGDAFKLLRICRRPLPEKAEDIGIWQTIFSITIVFAVWTNVGIVCFTEDILTYTTIVKTGPSYYLYAMGLFIG